jgi:hypothetical protein
MVMPPYIPRAEIDIGDLVARTVLMKSGFRHLPTAVTLAEGIYGVGLWLALHDYSFFLWLWIPVQQIILRTTKRGPNCIITPSHSFQVVHTDVPQITSIYFLRIFALDYLSWLEFFSATTCVRQSAFLHLKCSCRSM